MQRRTWLMLAVLAVVGCGGGGGVQLPGQKFKTKSMDAEQMIEVDNDTEAWALGIEKKTTDQPYKIVITADQPVGVSTSASLSPASLYDAHKGKPDTNTAQQMSTSPDKKEHTLHGTMGANYGLTVLIVRGKGSGPTKVTVKREQ